MNKSNKVQSSTYSRALARSSSPAPKFSTRFPASRPSAAAPAMPYGSGLSVRELQEIVAEILG